MHDRLQSAQCRRVAEHPRAEPAAIDRAILHRVGKCLGNRSDRLATAPHHRMDRRIGVVHRNTEPAEHGGGRALTHADRAGETDDDGHFASTPWVRRKSSSGSSGRPSTVK